MTLAGEQMKLLLELRHGKGQWRCHDQNVPGTVVYGFLECGFNADNRQVGVTLNQHRLCGAGCSVAGDDHALDVVLQQLLDGVVCKSLHLFAPLFAIRRVSRVAEEHEILVRQHRCKNLERADAANTGIEDADW